MHGEQEGGLGLDKRAVLIMAPGDANQLIISEIPGRRFESPLSALEELDKGQALDLPSGSDGGQYGGSRTHAKTVWILQWRLDLPKEGERYGRQNDTSAL